MNGLPNPFVPADAGGPPQLFSVTRGPARLHFTLGFGAPHKMKLLTQLVLLVVCLVHFGMRAEDSSLTVWARNSSRPAATNHPPLALTAILKASEAGPVLAFRLTNLSKRTLSLDRWDLPWGNPYSIRLTGITTDGEQIPKIYMIADRMVDIHEKTVTLKPGASIEGDYSVGCSVDLSKAPKGKDILLLWSYEVPKSLEIPSSKCTGITIIPAG